MSSTTAEITAETALTSNPLDVIADEMPFDVPHGAPISLEQAQGYSSRCGRSQRAEPENEHRSG
jgi:hypothetical protein